MSDLIIRTRGLRKDYILGAATVRALRGVDLEIHPGEFVAIMGPSGSGKSTFMNLIGCLDTPSEGDYWLNGVQVSELSDDELAPHSKSQDRVRLSDLQPPSPGHRATQRGAPAWSSRSSIRESAQGSESSGPRRS